ncbi:hypothetical protein GCM10009557_82170 [Virgisporangium ochraceum]
MHPCGPGARHSCLVGDLEQVGRAAARDAGGIDAQLLGGFLAAQPRHGSRIARA